MALTRSFAVTTPFVFGQVVLAFAIFMFFHAIQMTNGKAMMKMSESTMHVVDAVAREQDQSFTPISTRDRPSQSHRKRVHGKLLTMN